MQIVLLPLLFAAVLLSGTKAHSVSLPVDGVYGGGDGCELLSEHGIAGLVQAGGTDYLSHDDIGGFIVTAHDVIGPDWTCRPLTVDGPNTALECVTDGATWMPMPIANVQANNDVLLFTFDDEPTIRLTKCNWSTRTHHQAAQNAPAFRAKHVVRRFGL
jgi:hypothetical protein